MAVAREWSVSCRDLDGRRKTVTVVAGERKIMLVSPSGDTAVLAPLEVGRLRAALRDAIVTSDDPVAESPLNGTH